MCKFKKGGIYKVGKGISNHWKLLRIKDEMLEMECVQLRPDSWWRLGTVAAFSPTAHDWKEVE